MFGKDLGVVHEAVITGRSAGWKDKQWAQLAHNKELMADIGAVLHDSAEIVYKSCLESFKSLLLDEQDLLFDKKVFIDKHRITETIGGAGSFRGEMNDVMNSLHEESSVTGPKPRWLRVHQVKHDLHKINAHKRVVDELPESYAFESIPTALSIVEYLLHFSGTWIQKPGEFPLQHSFFYVQHNDELYLLCVVPSVSHSYDWILDKPECFSFLKGSKLFCPVFYD